MLFEVDLVRFVVELVVVVVELYFWFVVVGVELLFEVDIGFVGEVLCLVWFVVEGIDYMCEDIYFVILGCFGKEFV